MTTREGTINRLNWGCGGVGEPGWINSDLKDGPGVDISCDIRDGLPLPDGCIDYTVAIHALPEIPYMELVGVLQELRRVLKPGGTLRLALPDIDKSIDAYRRGDRDYFLIPDDHEQRIGSKFVAQMVWYGYSRTIFTKDFVEELLQKAGYSAVHQCGFKQTASAHPEIVELDDRELESMFVEAVK